MVQKGEESSTTKSVLNSLSTATLLGTFSNMQPPKAKANSISVTYLCFAGGFIFIAMSRSDLPSMLAAAVIRPSQKTIATNCLAHSLSKVCFATLALSECWVAEAP